METEPAKDLEAQKAKDPVSNATVADHPDQSQRSSLHAAPASVPVVESDHAAPNVNDTVRDRHNQAQATLFPMDENRVRPFVFFKRIAEISIFNLMMELEKTKEEYFQAESVEKAIEVCGDRLEDQLHRYSKTHGRDSLSGPLTMPFNTATAIRDFEYMNNFDNDPNYNWKDRPPGLKLFSEIVRRFNSHEPDTYLVTEALKQASKDSLDQGDGWLFKTFSGRASRPSDPLRRWLSKVLPRALNSIQKALIENHAESKFTPQNVSPFVDKVARFIVAMTGGLSLVVPMFIMSIPESSTRSLVTTSVAVVFFAGVISVGYNTSNSETLGITAAYAAVLVVFVGTSVQQASTHI